MMRLKSKCASLNENTTLVDMDPGSFKTFNTDYFKLVSKRRGLFHSDGALLTDPFTCAYVQHHATGAFKDEFFANFATSMIKLGNTNPLTGIQGEIRKKCSMVNH
ncbi:hypothetical protein VPH35_003820 [Triticum aestivum]|uniref:Plant heme peroxidase family profile domain-containing protein n=1 Tax=Triticum aestivum TaxID=4565 RepID=A0A3B5Y4P5_WHEAT